MKQEAQREVDEEEKAQEKDPTEELSKKEEAVLCERSEGDHGEQDEKKFQEG